jgi:hypothetical protein
MPSHLSPEIAKDILRYFVRNPRAADDLEGVARWRLLRGLIHDRVEETSRGLRWLVEQHLLLRIPTPGRSGDIFLLNVEELARAESFLAETQESEATEEQSGGREGRETTAD